jgi:myo-inositol-1(or 4)-monophosphatase
MRHSANLNVIIKAVEKAVSRVSRDFIELENLQSNIFSANKFASACYNRVKEIIIEDLSKIRPDYNMFFSDGQKMIVNPNSQYSYIIFPIDGLNNLVRSNPDFTVAIALQHLGENGQKETISLVINKIFGGETYYCEKGFGAYLNNRRIRVSKRGNNDLPLIGVGDSNLINKNFSMRSYGCNSLEIAYLASCRLDGVILENSNLANALLLLVKEAGGKVVAYDNVTLGSNGVIDLKF